MTDEALPDLSCVGEVVEPQEEMCEKFLLLLRNTDDFPNTRHE